MKILLDLKPLSVNAAYRGRRFDSPEKRVYDRTLAILLPKVVIPGPYYHVHYRFYLVNFARTDAQNLLKCLTDAIVEKAHSQSGDSFIKSGNAVDALALRHPGARGRMKTELARETTSLSRSRRGTLSWPTKDRVAFESEKGWALGRPGQDAPARNQVLSSA